MHQLQIFLMYNIRWLKYIPYLINAQSNFYLIIQIQYVYLTGFTYFENVCLPRFVFWNWIIFKPAFHDKRKVFLGVISILYFEVNFSHLFHFAGNHFAWGVAMLNDIEPIFWLIINAINYIDNFEHKLK